MYSEMTISIFIGLLTSIYLAFFIFRGKSPGISMLLMFSGFVGGWIGGMMWMFITGGLTYHILIAVPAVVTTILLCFFILTVFQIKVRERRLGRVTSPMLMIGVMLLLLTSVFIVALIPFHVSGYNVDIYDYTTDISYDGFIDITTEMVCVDFPRITANPGTGDYIKFAVNFAVSDYNWEQPYVKLTIVQDNNHNGQWDTGDTVWENAEWKVCTGDTGEDTMWRSNILYDVDGQSGMQIQYVEASLPIYHLNTGQFTSWVDDSNKQCSNTPEKYVSPRDQISWQSSGSTCIQKETITGFYAVPTGSSSQIYGKIYCSASRKGYNLLVIRAYDKRYQTDPFAELTPISEKIQSFSIGGSTPPSPSTEDNSLWYIAIGGIGLIFIASLARRKKPAVYYAPSPPPAYY